MRVAIEIIVISASARRTVHHCPFISFHDCNVLAGHPARYLHTHKEPVRVEDTCSKDYYTNDYSKPKVKSLKVEKIERGLESRRKVRCSIGLQEFVSVPSP